MTKSTDRLMSGRTVIVTGAGAGLGRAYALLLGKLGADVVVNDINLAAAETVSAEVERLGGAATANGTSVSDPSVAAQIVDVALERFGRVDAVINNAGTTHGTPFTGTPYTLLRDQLAVHLEGAFLISQSAFPVMAGNGYGRFVFTSSASGVFGRQMGAAYAAAKCAVIGLLNVIALEGSEHGVLANAILPVAQTDIAARAPVSEQGGTVGWVGDLSGRPRYTPDYVAPLAAYLASPLCHTTHGVFSAVGGRYAQLHFALGAGWRTPEEEEPPSVFSLDERWPDICSRDRFTFPMSVAEEVTFELSREGYPAGT